MERTIVERVGLIIAGTAAVSGLLVLQVGPLLARAQEAQGAGERVIHRVLHQVVPVQCRAPQPGS